MDPLIRALRSYWDVLPAMVGDDWPTLAPKLSQYLQYYESASDDERRARVVLELETFLEQHAPDLLYYLDEPPSMSIDGSEPYEEMPHHLGGEDGGTRSGGGWESTRGDEGEASEGEADEESKGEAMEGEEAAPTLTRYPELEAPESTPLAERLSIFFHLRREPSSPEVGGVAIEDRTPEGDPPEIEVVLRAPTFDIQGPNTVTLVVERESDVEQRFVLIPKKLGKQSIRVALYQDGRTLGSMQHIIEVHAAGEQGSTRANESNGDTEEAGPFALALGQPAPEPDLDLTITLDTDGRTLRFYLHSKRLGHHHAPMGSYTLKEAADKKTQELYYQLDEFAKLSPSAEDSKRSYAMRRIESIGRELWDELIPDELKRAYWAFQSEAKSLLLTSDEPWLPWELVKPHRDHPDTGEPEDAPFLCETFAMARWLRGQGPPAAVPIGTVLPVAPKKSNLKSVKAELAFLEELSTIESQLQVRPPISQTGTLLQVLSERPTLTAMHFACHGTFDSTRPTDSLISLDDTPLHAGDLRERFRQPHQPLVFINACHTGRSGFSFTKIGGWAQHLIEKSQVGAFIGGSWQVNDRLALTFMRAFYQHWLDPDTPTSLAEAVRQARLAVKEAEPWNPTWLAYVLYADPHSTVQRTAG